MHRNRWGLHKAWVLAWVLLVAGLLVQRAQAQPPPVPATFYGTVTLDGTDAPEGTTVRAVVNGITVAQTHVFRYAGRSVYVLDVPGDDPDTSQLEGGTNGVSVLFIVGNALAAQSGTWEGAATMALDLAATSPSCNSSVQGDVNCDCQVDIVDLMLMAEHWGVSAGDATYEVLYDLNLSGSIDGADMALAASRWRDGC